MNPSQEASKKFVLQQLHLIGASITCKHCNKDELNKAIKKVEVAQDFYSIFLKFDVDAENGILEVVVEIHYETTHIETFQFDCHI